MNYVSLNISLNAAHLQPLQREHFTMFITRDNSYRLLFHLDCKK